MKKLNRHLTTAAYMAIAGIGLGVSACTSMNKSDPNLSCTGCPAAARTALLKEVSARQRTGRAGQPALSLELHMTRVENQFIEAYVVWRQGDGPAHTSKPIGVSVMDRQVGDDTYEQLVKTLLDIGKVPIS